MRTSLCLIIYLFFLENFRLLIKISDLRLELEPSYSVFLQDHQFCPGDENRIILASQQQQQQAITMVFFAHSLPISHEMRANFKFHLKKSRNMKVQILEIVGAS